MLPLPPPPLRSDQHHIGTPDSSGRHQAVGLGRGLGRAHGLGSRRRRGVRCSGLLRRRRDRRGVRRARGATQHDAGVISRPMSDERGGHRSPPSGAAYAETRHARVAPRRHTSRSSAVRLTPLPPNSAPRPQKGAGPAARYPLPSDQHH
ncbi:hypothetical protein B0H17DRAFT_1049249 [Mycena rosella]|uniref:Uncharacterized protein n=1 Tax=Mycena rosella TaxID=1033263 RepID=A0AAD7GNG0_MYCRO|nr:hypothetical protein B0H17DRAFT_1049249 [Mycena rosella]